VLADKGCDTNAIVEAIEQAGAEVVIPSKKNRTLCRLIDRARYRQRNRVERFFNRLKDFRRLATRYEKTAASFLGFIHFFAALCWCDQLSVSPSLSPKQSLLIRRSMLAEIIPPVLYTERFIWTLSKANPQLRYPPIGR